MNLSTRKKIIVWSVTLFTLAFFLAGYFLLTGDRTNIKYQDHYTPYDDGWTITVNGETMENPTLPAKVSTHGQEEFVFTKVLPDDIPEDTAIITRNYHQVLTAKIDGELIFSYPPETWTGFANLISDEWCLINLKPEYAGKTIDISFKNSSERFFKFSTTVGEFYYGKDNALVHHVREQGFVGVIMGVIVSIIGSLILIVSIIYKAHTRQSTNTAMGIALLAFGIWVTNRAQMCLFPDNSIFVYWGSLMCLMVVAPFVFLYSHYRNNSFKRLALWGFRGCIIADIWLIISSLFIKYNIEYIAIFAYGLSMFALALTSYSLFRGGFGQESRNKSKMDRLLDRAEFASTLIIPVFAILEFAMYKNLLWTEQSIYLRMGILLYAITYMIFVFWRTFLVVKDRTIVTQKLHDSQLELMMGQIQPHFVFNTLSSIRALVMVDPKQSYDMLYDFSNYLRANIDNVTNLEGIKFSSEVSHIKSYVNIEKVRYADRLTMEYDIQIDDFIVPPLSIQPLVENAIKHGVSKKVNGGTVILRSYEEPDAYVVEVRDTGLGFNSESACRVFGACVDNRNAMPNQSHIDMNLMQDVMNALKLIDKDGNQIVIKAPDLTSEENNAPEKKHKSSGMMNILMRLREMANARIEISSKENEGTDVVIRFPKN